MPEPSFTQYQVNVFVDHSETTGAPVVFENNPTYPNLFGAWNTRPSSAPWLRTSP